MKKQNKILLIMFITVIAYLFSIFNNMVFGAEENTKAYFLSKVTKGFGQADCILLQNTDTNGNKVFGLIDTGRVETSKYLVEYLKEKGVSNLQFVILTHNHGDHTGGMSEILDSDIKIDKVFYKGGDSKYSLSWNVNQYKSIVKKCIEKSIPIYGSYLPSETLSIENKEEFKNILGQYQDCVVGDNVIKNDTDFIDFLYTNKSKIYNNRLLNKFDDNNTIIKLGNADIQLYNWEIFDENGDTWLKQNETNREVVKDENNNSLVAVLNHGNKKALFTGDMNNLDENKETGRIGDEDRLKDVIGDVDFLKLGHHGYQNSNTIDYLNTIKPEYAIITNDIGNAYGETYAWLEQNDVEYFYSTEDEKSMILTMTNNNIGLNYETINEFKNIKGNIKYIYDNDAVNWNNAVAEIDYIDKSITVNSWTELEQVIDENKSTIKYDDVTKSVKGEKLSITLSDKDEWEANSEIKIDKGQDITIVLQETKDITIDRENNYLGNFINVKGTLTLGTENQNDKLIFDGGDKNSVISEGVIIDCDGGTVNINKNIYLQNNHRVNNKANTNNDYNTYGSAVYVYNLGTFNMNGGTIKDNTADNTTQVDMENQSTNSSILIDTYGARNMLQIWNIKY